jgi:hypothetical protein
MLYLPKGVERTAGQTNRTINDIISQIDATLQAGKQELKWYSKEINEALFTQPYIKPKVIGAHLEGTSRTTLTKYMSELTKLKILSIKQKRKEAYYINNDLVRILQG